MVLLIRNMATSQNKGRVDSNEWYINVKWHFSPLKYISIQSHLLV